MAALFRRDADAQRMPWCTLIDLMADPHSGYGPVPRRLVGAQHYSCITLGTAQLGMDYGISNTAGRPNDTEALCRAARRPNAGALAWVRYARDIKAAAAERAAR
jgi:hypothetical protein